MLIDLGNFNINLNKQQYVFTTDQGGMRAVTWVSHYNVVGRYTNHQWELEVGRPRDDD